MLRHQLGRVVRPDVSRLIVHGAMGSVPLSHLVASRVPSGTSLPNPRSMRSIEADRRKFITGTEAISVLRARTNSSGRLSATPANQRR